jgi:hypothetical protein
VTPCPRSIWVQCLLLSSAFASSCGDRNRAHAPAPAPEAPASAALQPSATSPAAVAPAAARASTPADDTPIGCEAIPVGLVGEVLGLARLQLSDERIDDKATLCQYKSELDHGFASIRIERGYAPERFEGSKSAFPNATDVTGYGERAFMSSLPMLGPKTPYGIHSIAVLKGHTHMTISAPVVPEKVQLLARALLESL